MNKDTLIAQQALEIANLKERVAYYAECAKRIHQICTCIGGPLNDNKLGYTSAQLKPFFDINQLAAAQP